MEIVWKAIWIGSKSDGELAVRLMAIVHLDDVKKKARFSAFSF